MFILTLFLIGAGLLECKRSRAAASSLGRQGRIDFLKAAGQASTVGAELLRGVPTTHHRVLVGFSRLPVVVPARLRAGASRQAALLKRISGQSAPDRRVDRRKRPRAPLSGAGTALLPERTHELVGQRLTVRLRHRASQRRHRPPKSPI